MALKFTDDEIERAISNVYGKQNAGPNTVQSNQMFSDDEIDRAIRNVYGNVNQPQIKRAEANASAVSVNNDVVLPVQKTEEKAKMGLWDNVKGVAGAFGEALGEGVRDAAENFYSGAQFGSIATNQMADMEKRLQGIDITNPQRISDVMKESKQRAWVDSEYAQNIQEEVARRSQRQSERLADIQGKYEDVPLADWAITGGQGVGNLLPSMAVGNLGGAGLGTAFFAANAYGGSLGEALNNGATLEQAGGYAAANAALETAVEAVFGGIPNLGGGMLDPGKLTKKYIKTAAGRLLANKLADITGEGIEEVASSIIEPFIRRAFYDKNAENASLSDMAAAFGGGALVSAILGVYGFSGDYRRNKADIAEENAVRERATGLNMDKKAAEKLTETFNEQTAGRFVEENLDADYVMHNGQYVMQKDGQITQVTKEMFDYAQRLKAEPFKKTAVQQEQAQTDVSEIKNAENAAEMMQTQENVADMQQSADVQRAADNLQIVQELAQQGVAPQSDVEKLQSIVTGDNSPKADPKVVERENARVAAIEESARQGIASAEDVEKVKTAAAENIRQSENKAFVTQKFGDEEISRIEELATEKGYKVVYEADDSEDAPNGYIKDDTIYINLAGNSPYFNVAVHEVLHGVRSNTAKWNKLRKSVYQMIGSNPDMTKFADEVVAKYTENPDSVYYKSLLTDGKLDGTKLNEEIVANFVEEYLPKIAGNDAQLMEKIKKDRNLIDGLLDIIRGIKNNLAIKFAKSEKAMLDEAERNLVNLLRAESRAQSEDNVRFSISDHIIGASGKDYGKGVYLDSALLDGLSETEQKQMVRERVKELSGQTFTAYDSNGSSLDVRIARKNEKFRNKAGKLVTVNHDLDSKNTNDSMKRQAVILSDELIESASFNRTEKARYPHDWLDNNGLNDWDTWTVYLQEKNNSVWTAELKIANSKNGDKYLYDIVNIKMVDGGGKSPTTSTTNNIPQTGNNINGKKQSGNNSQKRQRNSSSAGASQGKFSRQMELYPYDGESAKSRGIRKKAVDELADNLGRRFGITGKIGKEGLRKEAYRIADKVEKFGFITKADMDNFFDAAAQAARFTDEKADYAPLKKLIRETGIEPVGGREYVDFLQKYKGKVKFKRGGMPIDVLYQQLAEEYPEYINGDITNPADQMWRLGKVYDSLQRKEMTVSEYYGDQAQDFINESYEEYAREVDLFVNTINSVSRYKKANVDRKSAKEQAQPARTYTLQDVQNAYKNSSRIEKEITKLMANTALTDEDKSLLDDLQRIKNPSVLAATLKDMQENNPNAKAIYKLFNLKQELAQVKEPVREYRKANKERNRREFMDLLTTSKSWREKHKFGGLRYKAETFERIIDDVVTDKKAAERLKDMLPRSIHKHVAEGNRYKNELRDRVRRLNLDNKKLYKVEFENKNQQLIQAELTESGLVQIYGEGLVTKEYLDKIGADVEKITDAAKEFRTIYNEMIEKINESYVRNGYKPIEYRRDYFPHFTEDGTDVLLNKMTSWFGIDAMSRVPASWQRALAKITVKSYTNDGMLPTEIAGTTYKRSPGRNYNAHALQRMGENTVYDALKGFDNYLETAADVIYLTDDIQNLRSFEDTIRYKFSDKGIQDEIDAIDEMEELSPQEKWTRKKEIYEDKQRNKYLNNFVGWLHNYTNLLAGKKDFSDRVWEENLGRGIYQLSKDMESRVAANMVAGNISSALTNVIPIAQMTAQVKEKYVLAAMSDTVKNMGKSNDGFAFQSDFLTNRLGSERLVDDSLAKKLEKTPGLGQLLGIMKTVDEFTSNVVVRGRYMQNINEGMSHEAAMKDADEFAAGLMADRSKGALPTIFETKNPVAKAMTMFQVEQNNQLQYLLKDLPRSLGDKDEIGKVLMMALFNYSLYSWVYNWMYEKIAGRKPAFSPIDLISDTGRDFYRVSKGEMKKSEAVSNAIVNVAEELPFAAAPLGMLGISEDAGRLPISGALPDLSNVLKLLDSEIAPEKKKSILYKEMSKPMYYLLFPVAGGQVKKTGEALHQMAANKGVSYYTSNKGEKNVQFVTDTSNPMKWVQSAAFGRWSTEEAREYVNNGFDYLSKSESQMYEYLKGIGIDSSKAYKQAAESKAEADSDGNGYLKTAEVVRYLDKTGMSKQDKANLFSIMLPNVKNNPYK